MGDMYSECISFELSLFTSLRRLTKERERERERERETLSLKVTLDHEQDGNDR